MRKVMEGVGVQNPVFDVAAVNAHLRKLNVYLDGALMARNDAFDERGATDGPGEQQYEEYVGGLLDAMLADFAMEEEDAVDIMAQVVSDLEAMGLLPAYPDTMGSMPDHGYTEWVAAAKSIGLGALLLKYAQDGSLLSVGG